MGGMNGQVHVTGQNGVLRSDGWLSRKCHDSRRKTQENPKQKVSMDEKLALALHPTETVAFDGSF